MFFDGSLQDGIALALQEQKVIVCFITCQSFDGEIPYHGPASLPTSGANDQSRLWADEYLQDDEVLSYFAHH